MVLVDDIVLARDYVAGTGNHKWNKPELQAAAAAMAWIIRELPGSPLLFRAVVDMVGSDPTKGLDKATALLRAQRGLHGGDLDGTPDGGPLSSTQKQDGTGLSWADISASQIPSAQGDGDSIVSKNSSNSSNNGGIGSASPNGKVSDRNSSSALSLAASVQLLHGPHTGAGVVGDGDEVVDVGANGSGVARVTGVGRVGDASKNDAASGGNTSSWRPRVCNQVWKGRTCKNRTNGCKYAHPTPCANDRCITSPSAGCRAFHPPHKGKGNGRGSVRKGGDAPKGKGSNPNRPNARRNGGSSSGSNNSGGNDSSSGNARSNNNASRSRSNGGLQLKERLDMMERRLGLQDMERRNNREKVPSYRDVTARGLCSGVGPVPSNGGAMKGDFGHARPDPAMLSTVVAAVLAVLAGGKQHF